jgi:hypothetical protein
MVAPGFINLTGQWQTRTIGVVHKTTSDIRHGTLHAHVHTQTVTVPPWKPRALGRAAPRRARHDFSCRPRSPSWKPRARGCASQSATWFLVQTHRMPHAGKPERDNTACLPKRAHAEMQAHVHRPEGRSSLLAHVHRPAHQSPAALEKTFGQMLHIEFCDLKQFSISRVKYFLATVRDHPVQSDSPVQIKCCFAGGEVFSYQIQVAERQSPGG